MRELAEKFGHATDPVSWVDLWNIYKAPTFDDFLNDPVRSDWDHVGGLDEATMTTKDIQTQVDCLGICHSHVSTCLAWTWDSESMACHVSPWMIVGDASKGKFSGVNAPRAVSLLAECP